jgi:hypothetical protein
MVAKRDPRSVKYDIPVRRALNAAVDAHARRRGIRVWVNSHPAHYRSVDKGGRTVEERAFTRACYWQVREVPKHLGEAPRWSLQIVWSPIYKRSSNRWGRVATLVLRRASSGRRWSMGPGARQSYATGAAPRSSVTDRVDGPASP